MRLFRSRVTEPLDQPQRRPAPNRETRPLDHGDLKELEGPGRDTSSAAGTSRLDSYRLSAEAQGANSQSATLSSTTQSATSDSQHAHAAAVEPTESGPMEAAARARMTPEQAQKVRDIEARLDDAQASEDLAKLISMGIMTLQDRSGKSILDQIHARLGQPLYAGDPPDPAPEGMREQALAELLHGIAHTEDICQGDNTTTCTTCVLQTLMARSDPANYARFALGLMFEGAGETPTGKRIQLDLGEVARRDDGSLVDPMIQGSLMAYGLSIGEGPQTGQAGGGRKGLGSVAGGGRGGTDGIGGGGRGGTGGVGGGGRGGTGGVGGNTLWPLAVTLRSQDDRMLSGEQLKGLIKSVMGENAKAITMGYEDENGVPVPASDEQVDKIRRALAGMPDN
ncbi:MAG: hypothetical protein FJZ00_14520, partial [Candidatus Sericytochromatia bacterium]|nr:hypothetical protein [Candidatus Tanganyikabacteria bacterium]